MGYLRSTAAACAVCSAIAASVIGGAAGADVPRAFSQIIVNGNARFSDQDVLATANLRPGEIYYADDLRAAIEALEFTGEFDFIRIRSEGPRLIVTVDETPSYEGLLTFGLGYDSDTGVFGGAVLSLENALGLGADVLGEIIVAQEVQTARLRVFDNDALSETTGVGVRLFYGAYEYDNTLFDYERMSIAP